jgi:hypothetical protein
LWLSSRDDNAQFLDIAYSGHGGYTKVKPSGMHRFMDGTRPKIGYNTNGITDHDLTVTPDKGGEQPLIDWSALTGKARKALEETDFDRANVPFKTDNFYHNLKKAML